MQEGESARVHWKMELIRTRRGAERFESGLWGLKGQNKVGILWVGLV